MPSPKANLLVLDEQPVPRSEVKTLGFFLNLPGAAHQEETVSIPPGRLCFWRRLWEAAWSVQEG